MSRLSSLLLIAVLLTLCCRAETCVQPLVEGYNAVGVCLSGSGVDTAAELLARVPVGEAVWRWHSRTRQWLAYSAATGGINFPLRPGDAVMVRCDAGSLELNGAGRADHAVDLHPGYNLVSIPASQPAATAAALLAGVADGLGVWRWDAATQRWAGYLVGLGGDDFAIAPGDVVMIATRSPSQWPRPVTLAERLHRTRWIAYAPSTANPPQGIQATRAEMAAELTLLRAAGFNGIVTYGADGTLGTVLPDLAADMAFDAMIMGIYYVDSPEQQTNAIATAGNPVVIGYCVGNEAIHAGLYDQEAIDTAMATIKAATGKPVTTTEPWNFYGAGAAIWQRGDWAFPTVHPWWGGVHDPETAATWTADRWTEAVARTDLPVLFKEVGLPTAGDPDASPANQATYYRELAATAARFCYFEAFDLAWKDWDPVEPHWGLWEQDRTPKPVVNELLNTR